MPNGGSDNCRTCGFYSSNKGDWNAHDRNDSIKGNCTIREIAIDDPAYTYCQNRDTRAEEATGPLFTNGVVFIYTRIPWYKKQMPEIFVQGICSVCGKEFEKGIRIRLDKDNCVEFCNDKHYVEWWQKQFPGEELYYQYDWDNIYEAFKKLEAKRTLERKSIPDISDSLNVDELDLESFEFLDD